MTSIRSSKIDETADGRKIARVVFTPLVPNPAAQSDVEVIWEVQKSEEVNLDGDPYAIIGPLSCTLMDTRENYVMSQTQRQAVIRAALSAASDAGVAW